MRGYEKLGRPQALEEPFRWIVGIEGSMIPHLNIDQYEWTQHNKFWQSDFRLAAEGLGGKWMRYTIPWQIVQPSGEVFDWSWSDERFDQAADLGLKLIVDLVHFGVPQWLPNAFGDVEFPLALERFARAFGERYRGNAAVVGICPINEPLTTAYFGGDAGLWPPHGSGLTDYMRIVSRLGEAFCRSTRVLRETMPEIEIVLCDSLEVAMTSEPESSEKTSPYLAESLGADVARRMHRRHLVMDLVLGRITPRHPLRQWMVDHGFPSFELDWFARNKQKIDLIGLDYYNHTEVEIYTSPEGYYRQRIAPAPIGLYRAAQDYWHRYQLPFMITETSAAGADENKISWFQRCIADVRRLRNEGFPCIGYTWWPLIDHVDWDGAMLHQTGNIHPVGIFSVQRNQDGTLVRHANGFTKVFSEAVRGGDRQVGVLNPKRLAAGIGARKNKDFSSVVRENDSWPILITSNEPWSENPNRIHHLSAALARNHQVVYIEPLQQSTAEGAKPGAALSSIPGLANLHVLRPQVQKGLHLSPGERLRQRDLQIAEALKTNDRLPKPQNAIVWCCDQDSRLDLHDSPLLTVYDYDAERPAAFDQDQLSPGVPRADLVLFSSRSAEKSVRPQIKVPSAFIPDGVDLKNFIRANREQTEIPPDSRFVRRPVMAYFGTINETIDTDLVASIADETLHWNIIMIGPVRGVAPEGLPRRENLFWLGPRPYAQLGKYARGVDLFLLPYKRDRIGQDRVPKQVREFLVTGRPVLATPCAEMEEQFGDFVLFARSKRRFVDLCHETLAKVRPEQRREVVRAIAARSWRRVALEVEARIKQVLEARVGAASCGGGVLR